MSVTGTAGGRIAPGVGANLIGQHAHDRNQDATIYAGNLDPQVTEEMVWELFTQAGPVVNVYLPKDRVTNAHQGYGFVEFRGEEDADYAIKILNMIKMFGKAIRVNKASQDKNSQEVGANLFIGNLDPDVDEKLLYDTFSAFGVIIATPKIMRDPDTGNSKGFGFVSYDCFEASDAAIEAMNGQYLCNRAISVAYAYKKDTKGERHGTPAERLLAEQKRAKAAAQQRPHTLFATGPQQQPQVIPEGQAPPVLAASGFAAGAPAPPPAPVPPVVPPSIPALPVAAPMPPAAAPQAAPAPMSWAPPPMSGAPPAMYFPSGMPPPPGMPQMQQMQQVAAAAGAPPPGWGYQPPPGMPPPPQGFPYQPGMPPPGSYGGPPPAGMPRPPHGMYLPPGQMPPGMPPPPGMQQMPHGMPPPLQGYAWPPPAR